MNRIYNMMKNNNNNRLQLTFTLISALVLTACANAPSKKLPVNGSYLQQQKQTSVSANASPAQINCTANALPSVDCRAFTAAKDKAESKSAAEQLNQINQVNQDEQGVQYLTPLTTEQSTQHHGIDLTEQFSDQALVTLTADDLPLKDYLHYVMGELLGVSYILGEQVKSDTQSVTLNLQEQISQRKLFNVSEKLLTERGYVIRFDEGIYYIHQAEGKGNQGRIAYGYGNKISNVPNTSSTIVQLVPFEFGMQTSLANTLKQLVNIIANPDFQRSTLLLQGKRKEIIKALEFIQLMDQPIFKNRQIGLYKGVYVSTEILMEQLPALLKQEGISVSSAGQNDLAVSLVPLDSIGTLILFANNKTLIDRVGFWAQQIDQAPSGNQLQYFLYSPQFARATDLGESLQMLVSGGSPASLGSRASGSTSAASQNTNNAQSSKPRNTISATGDNITLVVDERANALILNTTGDKYRQLLPLIKRLDVMPKQVILEVMIAEVKLTDEFQQGLSFALTNMGIASEVGGFNLTSGAAGLSYALSGAQGSLTLNLLQTNSHVNVLSRPSLLVRDGVTANITVGDVIPTVGQIVTDPVNGSITSIVYRKTGVELQVKPTINARGLVIMEIDQKISNTASGNSSVAGTPTVFERSIKTEVIAESGQSIILGGLMSENNASNDTRVPFFSSIPLVGHLFNSTNDSKDKTELVVLVTPRVIETGDEWDSIKAKLSAQFSQLTLN
jgi:general secretion pathway protein D